jgi:hypothetical protein
VALRYAVIVGGIAVEVAVAVGTDMDTDCLPYAYCPYLKDPYFIGAPRFSSHQLLATLVDNR